MSFVRQRSEKLLEAQPEVPARMAEIRHEGVGDELQIRDLLEASFPGFGEAILVDRLRSDGDLVLSLVAEDDGIVIGYIAFSRIGRRRRNAFPRRRARAARRLPGLSEQGVATRLVREGHACLAALGETLSVVLGEPQLLRPLRLQQPSRGELRQRIPVTLSDGPVLRRRAVGGRLVYAPAFAALAEDAPLQAHD